MTVSQDTCAEIEISGVRFDLTGKRKDITQSPSFFREMRQ